VSNNRDPGKKNRKKRQKDTDMCGKTWAGNDTLFRVCQGKQGPVWKILLSKARATASHLYIWGLSTVCPERRKTTESAKKTLPRGKRRAAEDHDFDRATGLGK